MGKIILCIFALVITFAFPVLAEEDGGGSDDIPDNSAPVDGGGQPGSSGGYPGAVGGASGGGASGGSSDSEVSADDDCDAESLANKPYSEMTRAERKCWNFATQTAGFDFKGLFGESKEKINNEIKTINYSYNNQLECYKKPLPQGSECPSSEYAFYLYMKYYKNLTSALQNKLVKNHNVKMEEFEKRAAGLRAFITPIPPADIPPNTPKPSGREAGCEYLNEKMRKNNSLNTIEYNIFISQCL